MASDFSSLLGDVDIMDDGSASDCASAAEKPPAHESTLRVQRGGSTVVVQKATYLYESKQLLAGNRLSVDRLKKVASAAAQCQIGVFLPILKVLHSCWRWV